MKAGLLISFYIVALVLSLSMLVSGCSTLPTFRYCDKVEYTRDGSRIKVVAECQAPVGVAL